LQKILAVALLEPDDPLGWVAARILRSADLAVTVFASAEEFIQSDQMGCTACLVVDVALPGMSGLQLQSHLAAAGRHIPIIFINGSATEGARSLARELGAVNFSDKPSGEKALLKEICLILKTNDEPRTSLYSPGKSQTSPD
jgi:FixJ family two-component response regulator